MYMFSKTMFGHFLVIKLVFNGPLCHCILLKEIEEDRATIISFKLLGEKVSFGGEDFDIHRVEVYWSRRPVEFESDKALLILRSSNNLYPTHHRSY